MYSFGEIHRRDDEMTCASPLPPEAVPRALLPKQLREAGGWHSRPFPCPEDESCHMNLTTKVLVLLRDSYELCKVHRSGKDEFCSFLEQVKDNNPL